LLPAVWRRRIASLTVDDVAELLHQLRRTGLSAKTSANALATPQSIMRFARRCVGSSPTRSNGSSTTSARGQGAAARASSAAREIERLLTACSPRNRLMLATVLYTGLRISEVLGLVWDDVDFAAGVIHVRAQLTRPPRRARPARGAENATSVRDVPLVLWWSHGGCRHSRSALPWT
jgi:integrase